MTNRRGFIASLLTLVPMTLLAKRGPSKLEPMRFNVTVNANDPQFQKAVVDAVMKNYNSNGAIRTREIVRDA